jgi:hypothetical protein
MNRETTVEVLHGQKNSDSLAVPGGAGLLARVPEKTQASLLRMFTDPYLLEKQERAELVQGLRDCVAKHPDVSELRVLFGMALCVDFQVEDAVEEFREGVRLAPDSFLAQLKMGELCMRLRICEKAEEHTRQAALLAQNMVQSEMARKQAAAIRSLVHNGIQRGGPGYKGPMSLFSRLRRLWTRTQCETEVLAPAGDAR